MPRMTATPKNEMKDIIDEGPSMILDTCEGVVGDSIGSELVAHKV